MLAEKRRVTILKCNLSVEQYKVVLYYGWVLKPFYRRFVE